MTTGGSYGKASHVLVTDAGRGSAIAIIRSLGRAGWHVTAADSDRRSPGFRSRYVKERVLYPQPLEAAEAVVTTLQRTVHERGVDLIIPVTDEIIHPLSHARDRFNGCQIAMADPEPLELVSDKSKTIQIARQLEVPIPATAVVRSLEAAQAAAPELGWPVVLKPAVSRVYDTQEQQIHKRSVQYANNDEQLIDAWQGIGAGETVLMQEYFAGDGLGVELLANRGEVLAAFQHRRLAELPITGGVSAWRESVALSPELLDYSKRLVKRLNWTGLMMVEFKASGDQARLMEINGRVWGSLPLSVFSGMDFPRRLAELYVPTASDHRNHDNHGDSNNTLPDYKVGVQAYNIELFLKWFGAVLLGRRSNPLLKRPPRSRVFSAAYSVFGPNRRFDIISDDDPSPGWAELGRIVRKFAGKLRGGADA